MLDNVLKIFKVKPQYDLNVMSHGQTRVSNSKGFNGSNKVIKECNPI